MGLCVSSLPISLMMIMRISVRCLDVLIEFDPFAIVYGSFMKQWYALCVFLSSYEN